MKVLALGFAGCLLAGVCVAQTTGTTGGTTSSPPSTAPSTSGQATMSAPATPPGQSSTSGRDAASGNSNQAVATTDANAPAPAKGSNSFTEGQAKSRIADNGFGNVSDLKKDDDGVWRGRAQKNGTQVSVWLDYKGNVGTQQ